MSGEDDPSRSPVPSPLLSPSLAPWVRWLFALQAVCFIGAGLNHACDIWQGGWLPYTAAPLPVNWFWTSLTGLDLVTAALLLRRHRAGVLLAVIIMLCDVAVNSYAKYGLGFGGWYGDLSLQLQSMFLGFVLGAAPLAWRSRLPLRNTLVAFLVLLASTASTLADGGDANPREPRTDAELRYWLQNMVWYHGFSTAEITAATGLSSDQIAAAIKRFVIVPEKRPKRAAGAPLLVLPYPGGRHPRIGFLDGAIRPQRETKVSVFTPWDNASYVVVDVPEAIFSNLGLTYLAHTHVPTVWTKQKIDLEPLEWNPRDDGSLDIERKLPNGIRFGAKVVPTPHSVRMELWLTNGTKERLTDLRVQNCVMLKGAAGFHEQTNANKVLSGPYAACRSADGKRWVITAWDPLHRTWANPPCPCLHSDPKFPDCEPGATKHLKGWLSFYEGNDINAEVRRIEETGWRAETKASLNTRKENEGRQSAR